MFSGLPPCRPRALSSIPAPLPPSQPLSSFRSLHRLLLFPAFLSLAIPPSLPSPPPSLPHSPTHPFPLSSFDVCASALCVHASVVTHARARLKPPTGTPATLSNSMPPSVPFWSLHSPPPSASFLTVFLSLGPQVSFPPSIRRPLPPPSQQGPAGMGAAVSRGDSDPRHSRMRASSRSMRPDAPAARTLGARSAWAKPGPAAEVTGAAAGPQEPEPVPQPAGAHHLQARPQLRRQRGPRRAAPPPLRCKKPFGAAALPPLDHERRESPQRNRRRRAESRLACRPRSPHPSARPRATTRPDARCSSANALSVPSPCRFPRPLPRGGRSSTPTTAAASTATSSAWPSASW